MDFAWSEEQTAIRDLTDEVLTAQLSGAATSPQGFADKAYAQLAQTELLSVSLSSDHGGMGGGLMESLLLLRQAARHAAQLPLRETIVMALPLLERLGDPATNDVMLRSIAAGETIVSLALHESSGPCFRAPTCQAVGHDNVWLLTGKKTAVPFVDRAQGLIVLAQTADGPALFLAGGCGARRQTGTDDAPLWALSFDQTPAQLLTDQAHELLRFERRFHLALSAELLGLSEAALDLTADYLKERHQFDVPIGSFQAVSQRVADAFIALETMRVALWRAVWLEDEGRASTQAIATARYLCAQGAHQVVSAAQHLHGGMGFDRDYPLHRYFLGVKRIEFLEGGASAHLHELGDILATEVL